MGYAGFLRALLRPLGVYDLSEGSFSGAELIALGAALDEAWAQLEGNQRETIPLTAGDYGLSQYERLFGVLPESPTIEQRRAAIAALLQVGGDSFSQAALSKCLAACGVSALVEETGTVGTVRVSFPGTIGEPAGIDRIRTIIEMILPCHLAIEYVFDYTTWGEVAEFTWGEAAAMTWKEFAMCR